MQQINNENCANFAHSEVCTLYIWISCDENMFNTWINVLIGEMQTYKKLILHEFCIFL
jgi:hypothetical protein